MAGRETATIIWTASRPAWSKELCPDWEVMAELGAAERDLECLWGNAEGPKVCNAVVHRKTEWKWVRFPIHRDNNGGGKKAKKEGKGPLTNRGKIAEPALVRGRDR